MRRSDILKAVYDALYAEYGPQRCPLAHEDAFQLLAAVMLSAQCTDKKVNQVTAVLFAEFPDAAAMAAAPVERIAEIIRPAGLYRNKSRNLSAAAKMICEKFAGRVPDDMASLLTVPGIGRKSANVILGNAFGIPGFPADTHVQRLLVRIGVLPERDPEEAERIVCRELAPEYWTDFSHLLIAHGRKVCPARQPKCDACVIRGLCKRKGL
ncbi:MAG: endonuclease III [Victivallaceae bacterium]|nr:endonuclease III [Victivallaceae bacterium]